MKYRLMLVVALLVLAMGVGVYGVKAHQSDSTESSARLAYKSNGHINKTIANGKETFRCDTFGDQAFWGDQLRLHQAIEGAKLGGVGPGVSPKTALAVGLKVELDARSRKPLQRDSSDQPHEAPFS